MGGKTRISSTIVAALALSAAASAQTGLPAPRDVVFRGGSIDYEIEAGDLGPEVFDRTATLRTDQLPPPANWSGNIADCRRNVDVQRLSTRLESILINRKLAIGWSTRSPQYLALFTVPVKRSQKYSYYEFKFTKYSDGPTFTYRYTSNKVTSGFVAQPGKPVRLTAQGRVRASDGTAGTLPVLVREALGVCS